MSWLWKNDSTSPAAFEKALSKLSGQISATTLSLESTRSRGRRFKALWTLYTTLTYLISLLILFLVIGPQNWHLAHYGGLLGGPTVIYAVRYAITASFGWRTGRQQAHLNNLEKQRAAKVADLKKATKYDSTQELLQKYGGSPTPKATSVRSSPASNTGKPKGPAEQYQRTGLPPPPTANIQSKQLQQPLDAPLQSRGRAETMPARTPVPQTPVSPEEPGFAPNAFPAPIASRANYEQTPHWYDRILDMMLGEDENLAKNRLVLLCHNCRLVNGQAPPGIKTLEQLGKWRCGSCGSWNGTESDSAKVMREIMEQPEKSVSNEHINTDQDDESQTNVTQLTAKEMSQDTGEGSGKVSENRGGITQRVTRSAGRELSEGL